MHGKIMNGKQLSTDPAKMVARLDAQGRTILHLADSDGRIYGGWPLVLAMSPALFDLRGPMTYLSPFGQAVAALLPEVAL